MIGFASIFQSEGSWREELDSALHEMLSALEGVEASQIHTVELRSASGHNGRIGFLANRIKPVVHESDKETWIICGQIFNSDASPNERLERWAANPTDDLNAKALELNGAHTLFHFDKRSGALHVFRDRGGVKPVFYHQASSELLLASGLRAIAKCSRFVNRTIDIGGLWMNIAYPAPPQPMTCFKNVHVVERGGYVRMTEAVEVGRYWEIPSRSIDDTMSFDDAVQRTQEALETATARQISASDGKIGSTLSGGVDSAYLTVLAHQKDPSIEAFTFKVAGDKFDALNEDDVASLTAKKHGITHHIKSFDYEDFMKDLSTLVKLYEQPGISLGAYFSIASLAKDLGYSHVINGLSADEQYGGFHYFKHLEYWQWLRLLNPVAKALPPNRHKGIDKFKRIAGARIIDEYYSRAFAGFLDEELNALFKNADLASWQIQQQLYSPDAKPFVDDTSGLMHYMFSNCPNHHLYRFETFANHFGVIPLYPFLDNDVIDTAFSIPSKHKVRGHRRKIVLKKAAEPWVVQPALTEAKRGVGAPVNAWIDNKLKEMTAEKLDRLKERDIFNPVFIDRALKTYPSNYGKKIWKLVLTELWLEEFVD